MTIDKLRDEKLQYNINREVAKMSGVSGKIDKTEYLQDASNQNAVIEEAKFTCSPASKTFEKQIKAIEDQGETKIKAVEEHGKQLVKLIKSNVC